MKKFFEKIDKNVLKKESKKYALIAVGGVVLILVFFVIYQKKNAISEVEQSALVMEIPDAEEGALHEDKREAYKEEELLVDVGRSAGTQSLDELFPSFDDAKIEKEKRDENTDLSDVSGKQSGRRNDYESNINRSAENLIKVTELPHEDEQPQQQSQQAELSDEESIRKKQEEVQRVMMEQLDQIMQKYTTPQQQQQQSENSSTGSAYIENKTTVAVAPVVADKVAAVSTLRGSRRNGFYGTSEVGAQKNTIKASVYGKHVIESGQLVRFRMDEPMQVGSTVLPAGSVVIGKAAIGEDRLFVAIGSIEYREVIYHVSLDVYDTDGMLGLYLPGSMEMDAAREIGSDVATAMSSSANNSAMFQTQPNAAEQLKTDVGRGLIQGTFRYVGRRLQVIKVTVQDKHKVLLLPKNQ